MKILKLLGVTVAAFAVSVPVAYITTVVLFPFWSWLESTFKIEAVGHSGPDDWCFELTYFLCAGLLTWAGARLVMRSGPPTGTPLTRR